MIGRRLAGTFRLGLTRRVTKAQSRQDEQKN
jgi:hypothetical protein